MVEKTKTMSENVITTLDPQMKEFMKSGGDIEVVVASDKEGKVAPVIFLDLINLNLNLNQGGSSEGGFPRGFWASHCLRAGKQGGQYS